MTGTPPRGFTLAELLVALTVGMLVLGSAYHVLLSGQRYYGALAAKLEAQQASRAATQLLAAELRELDPAAGDLVALGPDSVSIRAARGLAFVCARPVPGASRIVVRDTLRFGYRAMDAARDRARLFLEGDPDRADDDRWLDVALTAVEPGERCDDGTAGTALRLADPLPAVDTMTVGAPVWSYERIVYRLYAAGDGLWWLGLRAYSGGAWASISPVAGPLLAHSGLAFSFFDTSGAPTSAPSAVARVAIVARGTSSNMVVMGAAVPHAMLDSVATAVTPRNRDLGLER